VIIQPLPKKGIIIRDIDDDDLYDALMQEIVFTEATWRKTKPLKERME